MLSLRNVDNEAATCPVKILDWCTTERQAGSIHVPATNELRPGFFRWRFVTTENGLPHTSGRVLRGFVCGRHTFAIVLGSTCAPYATRKDISRPWPVVVEYTLILPGSVIRCRGYWRAPWLLRLTPPPHLCPLKHTQLIDLVLDS